jgi:pimeloyl-ACP methyl ester carboxylesterase
MYSLDTWTEQLADFVRDVIREKGGVYVAGNSLGGLLAVTVAFRHPEVRHLILLLQQKGCSQQVFSFLPMCKCI